MNDSGHRSPYRRYGLRCLFHIKTPPLPQSRRFLVPNEVTTFRAWIEEKTLAVVPLICYIGLLQRVPVCWYATTRNEASGEVRKWVSNPTWTRARGGDTMCHTQDLIEAVCLSAWRRMSVSYPRVDRFQQGAPQANGTIQGEKHSVGRPVRSGKEVRKQRFHSTALCETGRTVVASAGEEKLGY
jgi:hypothetical protein